MMQWSHVLLLMGILVWTIPSSHEQENTGLEYVVCDSGSQASLDAHGEVTVCLPCPAGTYKEERSNASCVPCPPSPSGYQQTTEHVGANTPADCIVMTSLISFTPDHGSISGGTEVTITVSMSSELAVEKVLVCQEQCYYVDATFEEDTNNITCTTSSTTYTRSGPVKVTFTDGTFVTSSANFSYMINPVVTEVYPSKTIIFGGVILTVLGTGLTSVPDPRIKVTRLVSGKQPAYFYERCIAFNETLMGCATPPLYEDFYHPLLQSSQSRRRRRKRDVGDLLFNDEDNMFYAGLEMDGVSEYLNLSVSFANEWKQLEVYVDPYIEEWEDTVKYDLDDDHNYQLDIWGAYMDYALTKEDYKVQVGSVLQPVDSIPGHNHLKFTPPSDPPDPGINDRSNGELRVVVHVGTRLKYVVGYIDFHSGTELWEVAMGVAIALISVVILLVVVLVCWSRRRRQMEKAQTRLQGHSNRAHNLYSIDASVCYHSDGYLKPVPLAATPGQEVVVHNADGTEHRPSIISLMKSRTRLASSASSITGKQFENPLNGEGSPVFLDTEPKSPFGLTHNIAYNILPPDQPPSSPNPPNMSRQFSLVPFDILNEISEELRLSITECMIDIARLRLGETIGKGYFGKVFKGDLEDEDGKSKITVAVKTVQGNLCTINDVASFLEEAVVMKDFDHRNVLSLLGVAIKDSRPFVILPYMEYGDLKSYISESERMITVRKLLSFGVQVADGMAYLAQCKFVHRDLATRNCMVDKNLLVKIADFGLSRDIYKSDYYRVETKHRPLPVKWMAVESLTGGMFSSKSDVWSYGVLLWELLTRGCSPYADINSFEMKTYLLKGRRLSQPEHAPDEVYELMKSCWLESPEDRPSFEKLQLAMSAIVNKRDEPEEESKESLQLIDP